MNPSYHIRPLDNNECREIVDLVIPIQQIEFNVAVTLEDQPDLLDIEGFYIKGGGNFWGAFHGEKLIGTIALINAGNGIAAIRKMFVRKEYRGKESGIAQALLGTLLQYCREHHIPHVCLGTVPQLKAAHRFYEKNGFDAIAVEDLPVQFPKMNADRLFYHIYLQATEPAIK